MSSPSRETGDAVWETEHLFVLTGTGCHFLALLACIPATGGS
jgi:predicted membrane channel-forming protein YqfA (hemolysin III family)